MNEPNKELGEKVALELCDNCAGRMREVLRPIDLWKGAANPNHLIKLYNKYCCHDCLGIINNAALKYARGAQ